MKLIKSTVLTALCATLLLSVPTLRAAEAKTYQVTGPVLEVTATLIVVQKGQEKWEIARDANTKITGELKVGEKVTITYQMVAAEVTVKEAKAKK